MFNAKGQGRPPILGPADAEQVAARVRENRQQLQDVTATLRQELDKDFSPTTLKRFLRPEAHVDFKTLKAAVWHILSRVGQQFTIQFST